MSKLSKDELQSIKKLCRIEVSGEEEETLLTNLGKILEFVKTLEEVDTEGVEPCYHVIPNTKAPLREDVPQRLIPRDVFLKGAPEHVGGMIKVPKVIKDQL